MRWRKTAQEVGELSRVSKRQRRRPWRNGRAQATWTSVLFAVFAALLVPPAGFALPDNRGWELVSPIDKNGAQVDPPETIAAGGVLKAAAGGGLVTYSSRGSFGPTVGGAPPASQYLATRGSAGWVTQNLTTSIFSSTYDTIDQGSPFRIFSDELDRAILLNGDHCRGDASSCAVANPPLVGTDAPAGFQDYYLWETGGFEALLGSSDIAGRGLDPATFDLKVVGTSPDLTTIVLSTCATLTDDATNGCEGLGPNVYKWTRAVGLSLINAAPGAALASSLGAVSLTGGRIYWTDSFTGNLYLNDGGINKQVDADAGGGGTFEAAAADGEIAYFTKGATLWRYDATTDHATSIASGVSGVLGVSTDGQRIYFQDGAALRTWDGSSVVVANGPEAAHSSTYPPSTGRARVSNDGTKLLFVSKESLTGYNNVDQINGKPDTEVFLYDLSQPGLTCVSCNPSGERPIGPSTISGAISNGSPPEETSHYKPRNLSSSGLRVFFDSDDSLIEADSNHIPATGAGVADAYEWESKGEGSCVLAGGCIEILSKGSAPDGASFVDASSDGADAYILTGASLVPSDPGSIDLYDARISGGFPEAAEPIPCIGDACQILPARPVDPDIATMVQGVGNPPLRFHKYCRAGYFKHKGICVKKRKHQHSHHHHERGGSR